MEQSRHWVQRLADGAQLYGETLPGVPLIEIAGDHRVLIENHNGVIEYDRERIRVRVRYGALCITGCGLELTHMTRSQLVISGQIDSVQLQRRCR
jgi:sporulation protein YqfC